MKSPESIGLGAPIDSIAEPVNAQSEDLSVPSEIVNAQIDAWLTEKTGGSQYASAVDRYIQEAELLKRVLSDPAYEGLSVRDRLDKELVKPGINAEHRAALKDLERGLPAEMLQSIPESTAEKPIQELSISELEQRHAHLSERPILSNTLLDRVVFTANSTGAPQFEEVDLSKVVGNAYAESDGWAHENEARKGRMVQVAQVLLSRDEAQVERVFHTQDPDHAIKMRAIAGPAGSMYMVDDGTHRVGGAMVAGLKSIPAAVSHMEYPLTDTTHEDHEARAWQSAIDKGLITGSIHEEKDEERGITTYVLQVDSEVVPWMRGCKDPRDMVKIGKMYDQLYPGSLDNLPIPKEALTDWLAYNYFMANRFEEWKEKQRSN